MRVHGFIENLWYGNNRFSILLLPVSWLYQVYVSIRRFAYFTGLLPKHEVAVPVIVVGNITVGGTGKTPLIIWLCQYLVEQGYRPGILSRGYSGHASKWPQQVRPDSDPYTVGDEPVLLARRSGRPVAVSPNRYLAAVQLLEHTDCNILLCDDGLQHLSLDRDLELAVIDGDRRFGNGHCLPAGPLREPLRRLNTVDMVIGKEKAGKNEYLMEYEYGDLLAVNNNNRLSIQMLKGETVHVVTGIANPKRFYSYLRSHDIRIIKHIFPDHYFYTSEDLQFGDELAVVMTEKDAVKCKDMVGENAWYIPINARLNEVFHHRITNLLRDIING
jgi:tetraacyldisaccharide 4'-kinase